MSYSKTHGVSQDNDKDLKTLPLALPADDEGLESAPLSSAVTHKRLKACHKARVINLACGLGSIRWAHTDSTDAWLEAIKDEAGLRKIRNDVLIVNLILARQDNERRKMAC